MSYGKIVQNTPETDNIFYDILINNVSDSQVIEAKYNAAVSTAVLENPSEYYISPQRFTIPLQEIPIFVFKDNTYVVNIRYNSVDYKTTLTYVSDSTSAQFALQTFPANRSVYNYQQFLDSVNNGIASSFNSFAPTWSSATTYTTGQIVSYTPTGVSKKIYVSLQNANLNNQPDSSPAFWSQIFDNAYAPYMTYEPTTELFSINASTAWYNPAFSNENQPLTLWFDTNLYSLFRAFNTLYNGTMDPDERNYQMIIRNFESNIITLTSGFSGYQMQQQFIALYNMYDIRNIVITTTMPIRSEYSAAFNNSSNNSMPTGSTGATIPINTQLSNTATVKIPILTDFQLNILEGPELLSYAQYTPTAEYRLIDMIGTIPLNNIEITMYWQDKNYNIYPIYIPPLNSADMKLLFRRKKMYYLK